MKKKIPLIGLLLFFMVYQVNAFSIIDLKALSQRISILAKKIKYWDTYREKFAKYSKWFSIYKNYLRHCMLGFEKDEAQETRIQRDELVEILNSPYFEDVEDVDPWKTILSTEEDLAKEMKHLNKDQYINQNWWVNQVKDQKLKDLLNDNQKRDRESLKHYKSISRHLSQIKRYEKSTWKKLDTYREKLTSITEKKAGSKAVIKETKLLTISNYMDTDIIRTKIHILSLLRTLFEDQAMERLDSIDTVNQRGEVGRQIRKSSEHFKKLLRKRK